jgi:hypothetical protein
MQFLVELPGFYMGNIRYCNRAVKQKISSHMEYAIAEESLKIAGFQVDGS